MGTSFQPPSRCSAHLGDTQQWLYAVWQMTQNRVGGSVSQDDKVSAAPFAHPCFYPQWFATGLWGSCLSFGGCDRSYPISTDICKKLHCIKEHLCFWIRLNIMLRNVHLQPCPALSTKTLKIFPLPISPSRWLWWSLSSPCEWLTGQPVGGDWGSHARRACLVIIKQFNWICSHAGSELSGLAYQCLYTNRIFKSIEH